MKPLFIAALFAFSISFAKAQQVAGIYQRASDFDSEKLSCPDVGPHKFRIRLNDFFGAPYITVTNSAGKQSIPKDSIFGYLSDGIRYRLFKRESYEVMNAGGLPLLYKRMQIRGGKGACTEAAYYFSKDAGSPVMRLSRSNIRAAYADEPAFVASVYDRFNTDNELIRYDEYRRMYMLAALHQKLQVSNP